MTVTLLFLLAHLELLGLEVVEGPATVYWPGDGYCGSERADGHEFRETDDHIAHRTLPLGTKGFICSKRTGLCVLTAVRDRGPFGATRPCGYGRCWRAMTHVHPPWTWRGEFDVTRPVARVLRHRGFEPLVFLYWSAPKRRPARATETKLPVSWRGGVGDCG